MTDYKFSPEELKAMRDALGLSAREFSKVIGVADDRTIRRYESGEREMSGTLQKVLNYLAPGVIVDESKNPLPRFLLCIAPDGEEFLQRNQYPRFIARINRTDKFAARFGVIHWIDEPVHHDQKKLLAEAIVNIPTNTHKG